MLKKVLMLSIVLASCSVSAQQGETQKGDGNVNDKAQHRWELIKAIVAGEDGENPDLGEGFACDMANGSKKAYYDAVSKAARIEKDSIGSGR